MRKLHSRSSQQIIQSLCSCFGYSLSQCWLICCCLSRKKKNHHQQHTKMGSQLSSSRFTITGWDNSDTPDEICTAMGSILHDYMRKSPVKILRKGGSPQNHVIGWTGKTHFWWGLVTPQGFQWGLRAALDVHHRPAAEQTQRGVEKGLNCPSSLMRWCRPVLIKQLHPHYDQQCFQACGRFLFLPQLNPGCPSSHLFLL